MTTPISSATTSALAAYETRQQASAHNLANTNTQGFEPTRVTLAEKPDQNGVRVQETRTESVSAQTEAQDKVSLSSQAKLAREEPSQTNITEEMTRMEENREAYAANTSVAQTQGQIQGTLVNQMV